jgi:hypothetical protein
MLLSFFIGSSQFSVFPTLDCLSFDNVLHLHAIFVKVYIFVYMWDFFKRITRFMIQTYLGLWVLLHLLWYYYDQYFRIIRSTDELINIMNWIFSRFDKGMHKSNLQYTNSAFFVFDFFHSRLRNRNIFVYNLIIYMILFILL